MGGKLSRRERREQVALWRYQVIRDVIDPELTCKQRGALVRAIAATPQPGLDGVAVRVSRESLDRWIKAWKRGGFDALLPLERQIAPKSDEAALVLACALKRERPERTCAQVRRIVVKTLGDAPSESTLLRRFRAEGLPQVHHLARGRFQADFVNEIWVGDALHGPKIAGRKTYLFAFLDDCARYVVAARWAYSEDTCRLAIALRPALLAWGIPLCVYVDNGAAFKDAQLARACARLGIRLIHSAPAQPQGRGKIERFFNTVTSQFLSEITPVEATPGGAQPGLVGSPVASLDELNDLFRAWIEASYHQTPNDTTGVTPAAKWAAGLAATPPRRLDPARISEAFLWSTQRTVTAAGTVQLFKNTYQVDIKLIGRRIELIYDPFDLAAPIRVEDQGRPAGDAQIIQISRHSHRKTAGTVADETPAPSPTTGIDYLRLLRQTHDQQLKAKGIDYTTLTPDNTEENPS